MGELTHEPPRGAIESNGVTVSRFVKSRSFDPHLEDMVSFAECKKAEFEASVPEIIKMSLLGASILTGNPVFFLLLKAITTTEFAIKAAKELERRKFVTRFETAINVGISQGIQGLVGDKLESFSDEITDVASQHGITRKIASQTSYNEDFVKEIFHRTATSLLEDGTERLANMVYDIV
jgi:hypothetical protein